ncbi:PREDICTED: uncharacterized protein LOC109193857 [Ipomoea nil]|uniref:uncharacterized protein LOC109193857 n=1 Tax=Ipomoea nil TaxID=35883 RepID=UPI00090133DD|nr:PREDICTED: uncharacterized protein LOC109193857 [Ipomoea nil]
MVKKMGESVKLEFTSDERSRRTKFKHRTKSLMKKIEQLSILCGIDVGAIIFANHADVDAAADKQLLVWPPAPQHLHQLLTLYKQKAAAAAADVNREEEAAEPSDAGDGDTSSSVSSHSQTQEDTNTQSLLSSSSLQQLNELEISAGNAGGGGGGGG